MKIISFILMLSLLTFCGFGQIYTNGVYVEEGKTIEIDKKIHEVKPIKSSETLYFSNDLIVNVYTNSSFTVNGFFQEILNTNTTPEKAKLGSHNFSATLMEGIAVVTYWGNESNSSCVVSTPMTDIELYNGTFFFRVNEGKVLVFVLNGSLKSHGDKNKENVVTSGYAVIAVPNDIGILEAKISLTAEKVKQTIVDKLSTEAKNITNLKGMVMFVRIDGKLVGIKM